MSCEIFGDGMVVHQAASNGTKLEPYKTIEKHIKL